MEKWKQNKIKYNAKYTQEHYRQIKLNFNIESDRDILEQLENVESKADYIRQLIRSDMKKSR